MILTRVLGGALGGSLILSGVLALLLSHSHHQLGDAKEVIRSLEGWQGTMVTTIGLASGNPKVTKDTAVGQVQTLGSSLVTLNNALKTSNDAVDRLADDKRKAEAVAEREMRARAAAIATAEKLRDELNLRAGKAVSPADMEAEVRRAQDASYEAGL